MAPGQPCTLRSLGRDVPVDSSAAALAAAAERIEACQPQVRSGELLRRLTSPRDCVASLRGRLLLLEACCRGLGEPFAFFLLGTQADVLWRGAPLRLFLLGLYRPDALRSYLSAAARLDHTLLTTESLRAWLAGRRWPADVSE